MAGSNIAAGSASVPPMTMRRSESSDACAVDHVAVAHGDDGLAVRGALVRQRKRLAVQQGDAGQVGIGRPSLAASPAAAAGAARRRGAGTARPGTRPRTLPSRSCSGTSRRSRSISPSLLRSTLPTTLRAMASSSGAGASSRPAESWLPAMTTSCSCGHARAGLLQETIELAVGGRRRIGVVENIARDQQHVEPAQRHERVEQPVEEALVFVDPVEIVQGLAQMPVGSVQQPHGEFYRWESRNRGLL